MKFSKKLIYISIFIIISFIIFIIYKQTFVKVKQIPLEKKTVQRTISSPGIVKSKNEADISFANIGKIEKIYVKKNSKDIKGTLLASIDNFVDHQSANG